MEEITKTDTVHLTVRVEGWSPKGYWLGNYSVGKLYDSLSDAIEDARVMWGEYKAWHSKQLSISNQDGVRIWNFVNGKVQVDDGKGRLVDKE